MTTKNAIAILGAGNIGKAMAKGFALSSDYKPENIIVTRRRINLLEDLKEKNFSVVQDNNSAVKKANFIILAVQPQQLDALLAEIKKTVTPEKTLISVVTGVDIKNIIKKLGLEVPVIRAMPNTAVEVGESMTCLSALQKDKEALKKVDNLFSKVGTTLVIKEEYMIPATALCACGIAFFFRAIRAASQGGIEIGFHSHEALLMSAQTAKGAAALLLENNNHPEQEVDKVTTPQGCTIAGLNQMEHEGFSSSLIKGILTSAKKAKKLPVD